MHCLGEGAVLAQPRDCPVPLGAGGVPGDVQQSERCDGSNRDVWGEMVPGELGRAEHSPPWHHVELWGRVVPGSWPWQSRGTVLPGSPARGDPGRDLSTTKCTRCSHSVSLLSRQAPTALCTHTCTSQQCPGESRSLAPIPGLAPSHGVGFQACWDQDIPAVPPHTGFTDSLETVTGAGEVRSIKQRAAARAGDSNNKSCCVQWLKLVFKKCPEKKLTPPKTRVGPIAANDQQD